MLLFSDFIPSKSLRLLSFYIMISLLTRSKNGEGDHDG